ncbi:hypothetical protein [Comamonas sp. NLF-1-9]|uniref:hypothetical protein n=1 Tax=Comamonas sp. NLF-1-9 TaxID=2853163 RepID=UPI001C4402EB|nr:hypothetical protein [Comamonas sp. NLF-1-9]QXL84134.1 hypothetical protein KUD94_12975 [Comamonas sp. NLF-1-9]
MQRFFSCFAFLPRCILRRHAGAWGAALLLATAPALAEYRIVISQDGPDVVVTGTGSVNTAALTSDGSGGSTTPYIAPLAAAISFGGPGTEKYKGIPVSVTAIGPGGASVLTARTGDGTRFDGIYGNLYLPPGYVSGTPLYSTMRAPGKTIAGLGMTPGTYIWPFGAGADRDRIVIVVVGAPSAIPALSDAALLASSALLALLGMAWLRRRSGA